MNKTMKTTAGLLAFVVLLGAGWTEVAWYIGKRAQRASVALIDSANEQLHAALPGVPLTIETESYDRGLFSSHARYVLQVRPPMAPGVLLPPSGGYALAWITVDIEHGPYPLRPAGSLDGKPGARGGAAQAASRIVVDIKGAPALATTLNLPQPLSLATLDGRYDYHGGIDFQWRMPPLRTGTQGANPDVSWHGATGKGRMEPDGALHMVANSPGLALHGDNSATAATATPANDITDLVLNLDLAASGYALTRSVEVTVDAKRWRGTYTDDRPGNRNTVQPWEARDLHWRGKVAREDGGLALDVDYQLGGLRLGKDELGQGAGRARLAHVDGAAMTRVLSDLQLLGSALVFGHASATQVSASVTDLSRTGMTLLEHEPPLALEVAIWQSLRSYSATLDASMHMGPPPQRTLNIDPLWTVLDRVRDFNLKAHVPGDTLRDFPRLAASLRESGLFVAQRADLEAAIHANGDSATVNGKAMPTAQWLARYAGPRPKTIALPPMPEMPARPPLLGLPSDMLQPDLLTPDMLNLDGLQDAAAPALPDDGADVARAPRR